MNLQDLISKTKLNIDQLKETKKDDKKIILTPDRWQPDVGKTVLRFLTSDEEYDLKRDMWFRLVNVHFFRKKVFFCLKEKGHKCPICEHGWAEYNRLKDFNKNLPDDKKDRSYSKFLPSQRAICKVLVKRYSADGTANPIDIEAMETNEFGQPQVKLLDLSKSIIDEINKAYVFNPEYGDITSIDQGFDFNLLKEVKKKGAASAQSSISLTAFRSNSPAISKHVISMTNEDQFVAAYMKMTELSPRMSDRFDEVTHAECIQMLEEHLSDMKNSEAESERGGASESSESDDSNSSQDSDFVPGKDSKFAAIANKFKTNSSNS